MYLSNLNQSDLWYAENLFYMLQKLPHRGIWVRMVKQMITSSTTAWTQVSHMTVHTIQAHTVLIMPYQDHEPVLYYCSILGSPSLSPNPVSPANSNLGKQNQRVQLYLRSISFVMCTYLVGCCDIPEFTKWWAVNWDSSITDSHWVVQL